METDKKIETGSNEERDNSSETKPRNALMPPRVLTDPGHQLLIIISTIFFGEIVVTLIVANFPWPLSSCQNALLDSLSLIAITFPILYFVTLRPMRLHIAKLRQVEKSLRESEDFLQTIIDAAPECIKLTSSDGALITMNRAGLAMSEVDSLEEIKGKSLYGIVAPEYRKAFGELTAGVFQGQSGMLQFEIIGMKGRRLWLETHAVPLRNERGEAVFLLGITRDITEQKRAEQKLLESEEKYRSLVESTDDSIYVVDRNYRYLHMNKKHIARMGFHEDEYIGHAYGEFHMDEETVRFTRAVDKVLETGESLIREYKSKRDNKYFTQTMSPVRRAGHIAAVTVISKDITKRKNMEEKLRALSITDELTGLYNRRGFFALCDQALKLCRRQKKGVFLLYADLDNLKEINDKFGHQEGDNALVAAADIFRDTLRESDIIARIGGDEFVAVPVGSSEDESEVIMARLQRNIESHNAKKAGRCMLSISCGTSYFDPQSSRSIDELVAQAEKMMYMCKKGKRL